MIDRDSNPDAGIVDDEDLEASADGLADDAFEETGADSLSEYSEDGRPEGGETPGEGETEEEPESGETEEEPESEPEGEGEKDKAETGKPAAKIVLSDGTEVTPAEVEAGFLRQADYTRKTQEVARERETVQAERATVTKEAEETGKVLELALVVLNKAVPKKPDPALIHTDAIRYMAEKEAHEAGVRELQALAQAQKAHYEKGSKTKTQQTEAQRAKAAADLDAALDAQMALLGKADPELSTDEKRAAFFTRATTESAKHYGLKPEEVGGIQDHRYALILKDALAFRALKTAKPKVLEKVRNAPPIRSGARQAPGERAAGRDQKAWGRLAREGSVEAAAAALPDSLFD